MSKEEARTLTFEQFHALRNRKRNTTTTGGGEAEEDESKQTGGTAKATAPAAAAAAPDVQRVSFGTTVGDFIEKFEVQLVVILLIALDCAAVLAELFLGLGALGAKSPLLDSAGALLDSFTGFTIFFFLIEVGLVFFAFGERALSHFGCVLDAAVVGAALYWEVVFGAKTLRLLGALRLVWRVVRLVNGMVAAAEAERDGVGEALAEGQLQIEQLGTQLGRAREALRREAEAKARVERQVQGYKDQNETLHEALSIAAMNAAETTLIDGGGDVDAFLEELEREEDGEGGTAEAKAAAAAATKEQVTARFVVSADGSYASQ